MSEAKFTHLQDNEFKLLGHLTYLTVANLLKKETQSFNNCIKNKSLKNIVINLKEVQNTDSSGIAFIVELIRLAHIYEKEIIFHHVPEQMLAIAKLSSVDELLINKKESI